MFLSNRFETRPIDGHAAPVCFGFALFSVVGLIGCVGDDPANCWKTSSCKEESATATTTPLGPPVGGGGDAGECDGDADADPKDGSISCVQDSLGVFVDGRSGDDLNALGTMKAPLKTINRALRLTSDQKNRVYVCDSMIYPEAILAESATRIYGGFDCGTWRYSGVRARILPSTVVTSAIQLALKDPQSAVVISDVELIGNGSDAVYVISPAMNLTFRRVTFRKAALSSKL